MAKTSGVTNRGFLWDDDTLMIELKEQTSDALLHDLTLSGSDSHRKKIYKNATSPQKEEDIVIVKIKNDQDVEILKLKDLLKKDTVEINTSLSGRFSKKPKLEPKVIESVTNFMINGKERKVTVRRQNVKAKNFNKNDIKKMLDEEQQRIAAERRKRLELLEKLKCLHSSSSEEDSSESDKSGTVTPQGVEIMDEQNIQAHSTFLDSPEPVDEWAILKRMNSVVRHLKLTAIELDNWKSSLKETEDNSVSTIAAEGAVTVETSDAYEVEKTVVGEIAQLPRQQSTESTNTVFSSGEGYSDFDGDSSKPWNFSEAFKVFNGHQDNYN